MTGRFDFRKDLNTETVGITEHTYKIILSEISVGGSRLRIRVAVAGMNLGDEFCVVKSVAAASTDLYEFGKTGDVKTPCVVITEVKVQMIETVTGQHIKHAAHFSRSLIVT